MIVTALRLLRDRADRADLRLINTAVKEMRYAFMVFSRYRDFRKAAVFGSARTPPSDPNYALAEALAADLAWQRGWMVMTGAGPGIMEAANKGAGERSFGINIRLPFEDEANPYVPPERLINFKYFFPRKLTFVKESHAFVLFPGGFGTLDETLETLTLMQTGKSDLHPVVLMEAPGTGYWQEWLDFARHTLVAKGMIADDDLGLMRFTHEVERGGRRDHPLLRQLPLPALRGRPPRPPPAPRPYRPSSWRRSTTSSPTSSSSGIIESIGATPAEAEDGDQPDLPRLLLRLRPPQPGPAARPDRPPQHAGALTGARHRRVALSPCARSSPTSLPSSRRSTRCCSAPPSATGSVPPRPQGWSVQDTISHLAATEEKAARALGGDKKLQAEVTGRRRDRRLQPGRGGTGPEPSALRKSSSGGATAGRPWSRALSAHPAPDPRGLVRRVHVGPHLRHHPAHGDLGATASTSWWH